MMKRGTLWPFPTPSKRENISHIPTHTLSQAERPRPVNMQIKAPLARVSGRHTEDMDSTAAGAAPPAPAKKTLCHFVQCWPLLTQLSRGERPWKCQGITQVSYILCSSDSFSFSPCTVQSSCKLWKTHMSRPGSRARRGISCTLGYILSRETYNSEPRKLLRISCDTSLMKEFLGNLSRECCNLE